MTPVVVLCAGDLAHGIVEGRLCGMENFTMTKARQ
jgi:hypothetical protein